MEVRRVAGDTEKPSIIDYKRRGIVSRALLTGVPKMSSAARVDPTKERQEEGA